MQNSERFDKQSWVKVYYVLSGGLKVYNAKVTCPVCFGITSPYNRESEPGRLPRWDLHAVKRHVSNLHPKKGTKTTQFDQQISDEEIEPPPEEKNDEPVEEEVELFELEKTQLPVEGKKTMISTGNCS